MFHSPEETDLPRFSLSLSPRPLHSVLQSPRSDPLPSTTTVNAIAEREELHECVDPVLQDPHHLSKGNDIRRRSTIPPANLSPKPPLLHHRKSLQAWISTVPLLLFPTFSVDLSTSPICPVGVRYLLCLVQEYIRPVADASHEMAGVDAFLSFHSHPSVSIEFHRFPLLPLLPPFDAPSAFADILLSDRVLCLH